MDRKGGCSEGWLEVEWWGWGSLRDLFKNILKQEVGKAKVVREGERGLKVSPHLPPKILITHF